MANISISTSFCRSVAALRLTTLLGLLAEKRVADKADVVLRVVLMSLPNRHLTDGEQHGWRPQSQRYGQISLPTSTKKVHQEVAGKIVLAALGTNGSALQYASERLRTDPKFVLSAVTQQGRALEHAPATLRANKDIVMTS